MHSGQAGLPHTLQVPICPYFFFFPQSALSLIGQHRLSFLRVRGLCTRHSLKKKKYSLVCQKLWLCAVRAVLPVLCGSACVKDRWLQSLWNLILQWFCHNHNSLYATWLCEVSRAWAMGRKMLLGWQYSVVLGTTGPAYLCHLLLTFTVQACSKTISCTTSKRLSNVCQCFRVSACSFC